MTERQEAYYGEEYENGYEEGYEENYGGDLTVILAGALCGRLGLPPVEQYFLSSVVRDLCAPQTGAAALILACAAGWSVLYAAVSLVAIKNQDI